MNVNKILRASRRRSPPTMPLPVFFGTNYENDQAQKVSRQGTQEVSLTSSLSSVPGPQEGPATKGQGGSFFLWSKEGKMPHPPEADKTKRVCLMHARKGLTCSNPRCPMVHSPPSEWPKSTLEAWIKVIRDTDGLLFNDDTVPHDIVVKTLKIACSPHLRQRWSFGSNDLRPPSRFTPVAVPRTPVRHPPTLTPPQPVSDAILSTPCLSSPQRHLPLLSTPTTAPPPTPLPPTPPPRQPTFAASATRRHLDEFNKKYLGLADFDTTAASLVPGPPPFLPGLPSSVPPLAAGFQPFIYSRGFIETCLLPLLQSGFVDVTTTIALLATHPLVLHLAISYISLRQYDFCWIRNPNPAWATQTSIPSTKQYAMLACFFHYRLDTSFLFRYLGNNYTGAYREVHSTLSTLHKFNISSELITKYARVMLTGCPNHFVAESSRANALLHWRRNHPSIVKKLPQVQATMNKEDRNNFVIPLPHWIARFAPHLFFTPQHILEKPGKKDRQIFDASRRYTPWSTPINMMTSTPLGSEEPCLFGTTKDEILTRIYTLRADSPNLDIISHANDVKSAFRQIKLHPDILGAFSYIIADQLFLSCGQPFGADFCPANWEIVRQVLEHLATALFDDNTLCTKHRKYLDRLQWDRSLGKTHGSAFTRSMRDPNLPSPRTSLGTLAPTPHSVYVDDGIYIEFFKKNRIERAAAASIEAIFILLGPSALALRQDPISFNKLEEMTIAPINRILGHVIDTRRLTVDTPADFLDPLREKLSSAWGPHRRSFTVLEAETLAGQLGHASFTAPWLRHIMPHVYQSLASALRVNRAHLISTSQSFRFALKQIKQAPSLPPLQASLLASFYQAESARALHHSTTRHFISRTLRAELGLICDALNDPTIPTSSPISHLIDRTPLGTAFSDSSLLAAGGYSSDLQFWWFLEWPPSVRSRTLKYLKNNSTGNLIDINVLEYAAIIITFLASYYSIAHRPPDLGADPHPVVLIRTDNSSSEAWAQKGSRVSFSGRALGRLQAALLMRNPVGLRTSHISTSENVVADTLSRFSNINELLTSFPTLLQTQKELIGCRQFHPTVTDGTRKNHFLSWCSRIGLPDPCCPSSTLQARNFILACYVVSLIRGETIKGDGFFIRHSTLMGYVAQATRCHTDRRLPSPRLGVPIDYVALMTDASAARTALLPLSATGSSSAVTPAAAKSEWCNDHHTTYSKIKDPLWSGPDAVSFIAEDFSFYDADGIRLHAVSALSLDQGKCTSNTVLCPVAAMLRIAQRAKRLDLPALRPVAVYAHGKPTSRRQITGHAVTSFLRSVAQQVYKLPSTSPQLKLWSPHSIRVTAANLLHRARFSDSFIKNRLRWKSDSFLMYLRNTFYTADQHSKALSLDITPPTLADLRPLEPHEDVLTAIAA
ncbi:hypothetical protein HJC23_011152 [Cyclotella cryptica]|uniref:C3H1-type domain-containing protein n=1 Tax=Cyclotella cryptica TaxID=29204 RepID=A0ABD3NVU4_9STRA